MKTNPYLRAESPLMALRLDRRDRPVRYESRLKHGAAKLASACVFFLVLALVAMPAPSTAAAGKGAASSVGTEIGGAIAVRELMRLDTELALSTSRDRLVGIDTRSETALALSDQPGGQLRLIAIYGVGKRLLAEVVVGGQPYVYIRGQPLPIGAKAGSPVYKLGGISGSCVQLERQDEAHTLCLHPSLKASR